MAIKKDLRILEKELFKISSTAGLINQSNAERDHYRFSVNLENSPDGTGAYVTRNYGPFQVSQLQ